jgi:hypothetical protein
MQEIIEFAALLAKADEWLHFAEARLAAADDDSAEEHDALLDVQRLTLERQHALGALILACREE